MCGSAALKVEQAWLGALSHADQMAVLLVVDVKYGHDSDADILSTLTSKSATDLLDEDPVKSRLKEIQDALKDEDDQLPGVTAETTPSNEPEAVSLSNIWKLTSDQGCEDSQMSGWAHPELAKSDPELQISEYRQYTENIVSRYVTTIVEPASASAFADVLRASSTGSLRGSEKGYIVVNYDTKQTGET
eukprot:5622552-Pyramimonas_sp.AAC.1